MSLASVLFESASPMALGMTSEDMSRYNYSDGHLAIYTETAFELRDVFKDTFYEANQIELQAIHEGTTVDESYEYQEVMEGLFRNGIDRLVETFKNFWAKVVSFFTQLKSKFMTITKDNEKFVEKFNDSIKGKSLNLSGFKYRTYAYSNIDEFETNMNSAISKARDNVNKETNAKLGIDSPSLEDQEALSNSLNNTVSSFLKDMTGTDDEDDANEAMWSRFRSGARRGDDRSDIEFSSLDKVLSVLKSTKTVKDVDMFRKKVDSDFNKTLGILKSQQKEAAKGSDTGGRLAILKSQVACINKLQVKSNQFISLWRQAVSERINTYRNICHAAVAYSNRRK